MNDRKRQLYAQLDVYRAKEREALEASSSAADPIARRTWRELAEGWRQLADHAEYFCGSI